MPQGAGACGESSPRQTGDVAVSYPECDLKLSCVRVNVRDGY